MTWRAALCTVLLASHSQAGEAVVASDQGQLTTHRKAESAVMRWGTGTKQAAKRSVALEGAPTPENLDNQSSSTAGSTKSLSETPAKPALKSESAASKPSRSLHRKLAPQPAAEPAIADTNRIPPAVPEDIPPQDIAPNSAVTDAPARLAFSKKPSSGGPQAAPADRRSVKSAPTVARKSPPLVAISEVQPARFQRPAPELADAPPGAQNENIDALIAGIEETEALVEIESGRSKLIRTRQPIRRVAVSNPAIADIVQYGPQEFELVGTSPGRTNLTIWFGDDEPTSALVRYEVRVSRDTNLEEQRRIAYGDLQATVNEMFPNSMIYLIPVADKLVVKGQARDPEEAAEIISIVRTQAVTSLSQLTGSSQGPAAGLYGNDQAIPASGIINLLQVPGEQQVMLKVRIAEINRTAARNMGVNLQALIGNNLISTATLGAGDVANVVALLDGGRVNVFMQALERNAIGKLLAEPNLVTLSGRPANFIAGGEFAVPTVVGIQGAGAAFTQFRGFGTQLTFVPTVIDKDRIRLQVSPEFSALNAANAVNGIPGLTTRAANTTVEMREGQWLAIAGLVLDEQTGSSRRIPVVGNIPVIKMLFSTKAVNRSETELIVLVSPELVHPLEPEEMPCLLPGMEVTEPNDIDFFVGGQIEGRPCCHHRSTVWPWYRDRLLRSRLGLEKPCEVDCEGHEKSTEFYMSGPHGFSQ